MIDCWNSKVQEGLYISQKRNGSLSLHSYSQTTLASEHAMFLGIAEYDPNGASTQVIPLHSRKQVNTLTNIKWEQMLLNTKIHLIISHFLRPLVGTSLAPRPERKKFLTITINNLNVHLHFLS